LIDWLAWVGVAIGV